MNTRSTLNVHRPCGIGEAIAHTAFGLGLHGSTGAVANALGVSDDTASRILSRDRANHRDASFAETGALIELIGAPNLLRVLAAMQGVRVVPLPEAATVDMQTEPTALMLAAAAFAHELAKAVASNGVDDTEWASLLPQAESLHARMDRLVAGAAAKRVRA